MDTSKVEPAKSISDTLLELNGAYNPAFSLLTTLGLPTLNDTVSCPVAGTAPLQTPVTEATASRSIVNPSGATHFTLLNTSSSEFGLWYLIIVSDLIPAKLCPAQLAIPTELITN